MSHTQNTCYGWCNVLACSGVTFLRATFLMILAFVCCVAWNWGYNIQVYDVLMHYMQFGPKLTRVYFCTCILTLLGAAVRFLRATQLCLITFVSAVVDGFTPLQGLISIVHTLINDY